jgi:hypothetical protein
MNNDKHDSASSEQAGEHHPEHHHFDIQIDGIEYKVTSRHMTGLELRRVPKVPIGPDHDLFEGEPGGSDRKIGDERVVEMRNGLRFFTASVHFDIHIDGIDYKVTSRHMTGLELRHVPKVPIGPDRNLFEGEPGGSDRKIGDEQVIEIRNGLRFFTVPVEFEIQIDRTHYKVTLRHMTGLELRHVPKVPIGPDRDLFEVVPGGSDRKIGDEQIVEIRNGLRFFTAPAQINPGAKGPYQEDRRVTIQ